MFLEENDSMSTEPQADTSRKRTTKFQDHLLVALGDLEQAGTHDHNIPHGLAIRDEIEASDYGPTEVHHSRLYQNLDTLVEHGLVEKSEIDDRTNGFQLTQPGRQHLAQAGNRFLSAAPETSEEAQR
jgi:hypothetical protein